MSESGSGPYRAKRAPWIWLIVLALALAAGYWFLWKKPQSAGAADAAGRPGAAATASRRGGMAGMGMATSTPVKAVIAHEGRIENTLKAIGMVTAFNTVVVRSRVDGELQSVLFTDGQKVKKGDLLAQIDPRTYQVQLDQAMGQQKQNEAQLANAQRDLQRYQLLFKQNSIAKQQVDAQAALVQQYLGSRKSDQAAVDNAALQLEFTKITAPISGRLGLRMVDEGNLISASGTEGIVVITQTQPISVLFSLPQVQLPDVIEQVRAGKALAVDLYDRDDIRKLATGELMSIDNQIDTATGTLKLKARFANEDESLFPNQFVNVRLRVSAEQAIVLPSLAIQQGSIGSFVYVIKEDNTVHVQPVVTGVVDGQHIAVSSGLQAGQRVVVEGVDRLREGAAVQVMPDSGQATQGASPTEPAAAAPAGSVVGSTLKSSAGSPH